MSLDGIRVATTTSQSVAQSTGTDISWDGTPNFQFGNVDLVNNGNGDPTIINLGDGLWYVRAYFEATPDVTLDIRDSANTTILSNTILTPNANIIEAVVDGFTYAQIKVLALCTQGGKSVSFARIEVAAFDAGLAHARFDNNATTQAIANTTDTVAAFGHDVATHPYVTRSTDGSGHKFTLSRGGIWAVTATMRFVGGTAGERYAALMCDNYATTGSLAVVTAEGGSSNSSTPETFNLSYTDYIGAGKSVKARVWQSSGGSLNLDGSNIWKNITFALVSADG